MSDFELAERRICQLCQQPLGSDLDCDQLKHKIKNANTQLAKLEEQLRVAIGGLVDCRTEAIIAIEERTLADVEEIVKTVNSTLDILAKIKE